MADNPTEDQEKKERDERIVHMFEQEGLTREQIAASLVSEGIDEQSAKLLVDKTLTDKKASYAWGILWGVLWCVGGIVATAASYSAARPGGRYSLFWGAVLYGIFKLIVSIWGCVKYSRMSQGQQAQTIITTSSPQVSCGMPQPVPSMPPAFGMAPVQGVPPTPVIPSQPLPLTLQTIAVPPCTDGDSTVSVGRDGSKERFYYVMVRENRLGPFDHQQLVRLLTSGQVTADTLVWTEGMEQWQPIRQVQLV